MLCVDLEKPSEQNELLFVFQISKQKKKQKQKQLKLAYQVNKQCKWKKRRENMLILITVFVGFCKF